MPISVMSCWRQGIHITIGIHYTVQLVLNFIRIHNDMHAQKVY